MNQSFTGRADGRYRLGGAQNLATDASLFDVPIGNGVDWIDERARGGDTRGSMSAAVLLEAADPATSLPTSLVTGADRDIDMIRLSDVGLIIQGVEFTAATLATHALVIRADDGTEFGWRFSLLGTEAAAPETPAAPTAPAGSSIDPDTGLALIRWIWFDPDANGSPITSYVLDLFGSPSSVFYSFTGRFYEITTPSESLRFRVKAVNSIGESQWSEWSETITP